ncbi:DUF808 domain-containing protein [Albibacterium profundi]|uniref:DUF808 family protein n=1 Tax=Albibacterium profundi TaxID=3134906 RepID=A0ABV5CIK1_9SPHI
MASGVFTVLDDIAALMDDVAVASKVATRKTAAILGDDLAVNAEKATGFLSSRELPVLWAISKGSLLNKVIIVPVAFLLNFFLPVAIKFILVIGGVYLAYEGMEKIVEYIFHRNKKGAEVIKENNRDNQVEEKLKIKSAITTDFILSIEIVFLALGSVLEAPLEVQIFTVCIVALLATVGVYGIVALIVRMDDAGYRLIKKSENKGFLNTVGESLVKSLPMVIRLLSVVGTIALLLVSGGIFSHNVPFFHDFMTAIPSTLKDMILGIIIGSIAVGLMSLIKIVTTALKKG